jgi:hypothetical protein
MKMLFDVVAMRCVTTDWFAPKTNARLSHFRPGDLPMVYKYIGQFFDAHVRDARNKVSVPINCPHPWPPMLEPIWLACGHNEEQGAMLLGNLYCRYAIQRPELWWTVSNAILDWKPRLYVVDQHLRAGFVDSIEVK